MKNMANKLTNYVCELTEEQGKSLKILLEERGWEFSTMQYAQWKATKEKTNIVFYNSKKLTVQGRGTDELVLFLLEPEILKIASLGYEEEAQDETPTNFTPHAGVDESGKGDYFGPLCICCVFLDETDFEKLIGLGIQDSKNIKSKKKILELAKKIKEIIGYNKFAQVIIGNESYNKLYDKIGNLNKLLAWGHARSIENLLEKTPKCTEVLCDKFGKESLIKEALLKKGKKIKLRQETKAESDIVVAAASILAREAFVLEMDKLSKIIGKELPKGAGPKVLQVANELAETHSKEDFNKIAKLHFKTTSIIFN
jgi:ribonuclease HIII